MAKSKLVCSAYSTTKPLPSYITNNTEPLFPLEAEKSSYWSCGSEGLQNEHFIASSGTAQGRYYNDSALLSVIAGSCIFSCSQYVSPSKLYKLQHFWIETNGSWKSSEVGSICCSKVAVFQRHQINQYRRLLQSLPYWPVC